MNLASPFLFQMLYFAGIAVFNPFLALYYQSIGRSGAEIGLLTGIMPLVSMLGGPVWGALSDVTHKHRIFLSIAIVGAIAISLLIPSAGGLAALLVLVVLYAFISAPIQSLGDSATISMLGEQRNLYGRVRVGGTLGFGIMTIPAGIIIGKFGLSTMFWMYAAIMCLVLIVAQFLSFSRAERTSSFLTGLGSILKSKYWLIFLGMTLVAGMGMSVINTYFLIYMEDAGIQRSIMGFALALATAAEIPVMLASNWLMRKFRSRGMIVIGLSFISLRLILLALFPQPIFIFSLQLIHGLTFAAVWLAGINYVAENTPPGLQATTQAIFGGVMMNLGSALGNAIGGALLERFTSAQMYGIIGGLVLLGLVFFTFLGGVRNQPPVPVEEPGVRPLDME